LLDLWAASLSNHNDSPPFNNAAHLFDVIDSVKTGEYLPIAYFNNVTNSDIGGRPWKSFEVQYSGVIPEADAPEWMSATYEVWYRDPVQVFADLLGNPDFKSEWDAAPLRQYDGSGERVWCNFMSGNWAWKQCVCCFCILQCRTATHLSIGPNICR
jgi:hypothetical protein